MESKTIDQAVEAVMKAVGYVQKTRSQGLNYSYAGEAELIQAIRPAMVEAGLSISVNQYAVLYNEQFTNANGKLMNRVLVSASGRLHFTNGDTREIAALGEGIDAGDKATYKAMTGAFKYLLRQTFMIETGDDPDKTPSDEQSRPAPAARPAAPRPAAPPPEEPAEAPTDADEPANEQALSAWGDLKAKAAMLGVAVPTVVLPVTLGNLRRSYSELAAQIKMAEQAAKIKPKGH